MTPTHQRFTWIGQHGGKAAWRHWMGDSGHDAAAGTNVVSEVRKSTCHKSVQARVAAQPTDTLYISAITVLEIQRGISQAAQRGDEVQAAVFNRWLEEMVLPAFAGRILPVDHRVARRVAQLPWADARDYRDPLIAATGLVSGAAVATQRQALRGHWSAVGESVGVRMNQTNSAAKAP